MMLRSQSDSGTNSINEDIKYRIQGGEALRVNPNQSSRHFLSSQFGWLDKLILYLPLFVRIKPSNIRRSKACSIFITFASFILVILLIPLCVQFIETQFYPESISNPTLRIWNLIGNLLGQLLTVLVRIYH